MEKKGEGEGSARWRGRRSLLGLFLKHTSVTLLLLLLLPRRRTRRCCSCSALYR